MRTTCSNIIELSDMDVRTRDLRKSLLCIVLLLAGCVPTIPYGIDRVYDIKAYETLHPCEATRADVLMTLGEPLYRLEEDRFFMYKWKVVYAWGYIPYGTPFPICNSCRSKYNARKQKEKMIELKPERYLECDSCDYIWAKNRFTECPKCK